MYYIITVAIAIYIAIAIYSVSQVVSEWLYPTIESTEGPFVDILLLTVTFRGKRNNEGNVMV